MSMLMLGDRHRQHPIPTIQVPPWPVYDEPTSPYSPLPVSGSISASSDSPQLSPYLLGEASLAALSRFLPSNGDESPEDTLMDAYSCDEFRMYEFKVRRCARGRSHDWTECPYAHPGEKARRRDPRKYHYSGTACPDFRKGSCKRGDSCEFSHGVFECWLHPDRYRTQPCKDGVNCRRRVCFFAHTPEQLRVLPQQSPRACDSYDGSPMRHTHHYNHHHNTCLEAYLPKGFVMSSSPTSTLLSPPHSPPSDSPPLSPSGPPAVRRGSCSTGASSVNEVLASLRKMQISKAKSSGSPLYGGGLMDGWDEPMERVESGRDLRVKMAERLSKENPLEGGPDVGWVSDLLN